MKIQNKYFTTTKRKIYYETHDQNSKTITKHSHTSKVKENNKKPST